jgi:serine/threonine-protein kinase
MVPILRCFATLLLPLSVAVSGCSVCDPGDLCVYMGTDGPGVAATGQAREEAALYGPADLAFDPQGRAVIVERSNHRLIRIEDDDTVRILLGVAGAPGRGPDGLTADARLREPTDVAFRADGTLVVAAWRNWRIAEAEVDGEFEFTCGTGDRDGYGDGGPASEAALDLPASVAVDSEGNVYIGDQANHRIRIIDSTGTIETFAGTGEHGFDGDGRLATETMLAAPAFQQTTPALKITLDEPRRRLLVADTHNGRIRAIDLDTRVVTTVAGRGETPPDSGPSQECVRGCGWTGDGGPAVDAELAAPTDVAVASDGTIYIADPGADCVRAVDPDGTIRTAAGVCGEQGDEGLSGPADEALLSGPFGVAVHEGVLYIADSYNHRVVYVVP